MPRGLTRRLPALLAAPVLAAVLASGCADEAAAAQVGDTTISNRDLMDEVEAIAGNDVLLQAFQIPPDQTAGEAKGSFSQPFVGYVLNNRIVNELLLQVLDDEGADISDGNRADAEQQLAQAFQQGGGSLDDLSDAYRDLLLDDLALSAAVAGLFGDGEAAQRQLFAAVQDKADEADIEVSSRYGSWDNDQLTVVPPEGPVQVSEEPATELDGLEP